MICILFLGPKRPHRATRATWITRKAGEFLIISIASSGSNFIIQFFHIGHGKVDLR